MPPTQTIVPPLDPFGVPAAPWIFVALLLLTMLLHVVCMNFVVGGAVVATALDAVSLLRRLRRGAAARAEDEETVRIIWQILPVALSLAITFGVAPLLFVQVLYGHVFYAANVFMGFVWFAVIPLLIVGFYVAYAIAQRLGNALVGRRGAWDGRPGRRIAASAVAAAIFLAVAWVLTNNHMLSIQPAAWPLDGAWRQNRLIVTPGLTLPRFAHNVGGMLVVTGVWIGAIGWWRRWRGVGPPERADTLVRSGLWIAAPLLVAAAVAGPVMLLLLPADVRSALLSPADPFALAWMAGILGVAAQMYFAARALREPRRFVWFAGLAGCALATLAGMLAGRERVRLAFLSRPGVGFALSDWPVHWQRSSLAIFAGILLAALPVVVWLVRAAVGAPRTPAETPPRGA